MASQDTQLISSISALNLVVKDIFCDDFLFKIPNYQRPYSWEEEHCTQLLDDLDTFAFRDTNIDNLSPYFLGSAVVIKTPTSRNAQIVDGQQRLTTLTILLSCLRHAILDREIKETLSDFIYQKGNKLKGTSATYRLQTRKRDQEFFNRLIQQEHGIASYIEKPENFISDNESQDQMLANTDALLKAFENKGYNQIQLEHLATFIVQRCLIVIVASTGEEMAFRIFNVLNDRGKDLTIADILKSEILEKLSNKEEEDFYAQKWEDCESKLGSNFKDFFSHLRAIFAKKKAEESVISEIRKYVRPSEKPEDFINRILIPFSTAYSNIIHCDYKSTHYAEEINNLFFKLKRVGNTDWIPSAIYYLAKNQKSSLEIKNFLVQLEKLTLGMEAMGTSINQRLERFAKINSKIETEEDLFEENSEFLLGFYDFQSIKLSLHMTKIYGKRSLKPILAKIEEQMNDGSINVNYGALNIEHILPQNPTDEYWKSRFSIEDRLKFTNCLGNLSLISIRKNAQAKNYHFKRKISVYFKADGRASNLAMVNDLSNSEEWSLNEIMNRDRILLDHFLKALGYDNLKPVKENFVPVEN